MNREQKIKLLKQLAEGSISLNELRPRATINLIDWGRSTKLIFNGVNITESFMIEEARKFCPGAEIEHVNISEGDFSVRMKNETPLGFRSIIIHLEPDFEPFNILTNS